jgi:beta-mannanase
MGIYAYYTNFTNPPTANVLATIQSFGAIPLISWHCAPVWSVSSGADDQIITQYAQALKAYGGPVLLRWYWEMNNKASAGGFNKGCGAYGHPGKFVAAWKHIHSIFTSVGATNVAFVWNPTAGMPSSAWYPGSGQVDWIGGDGYDRTNTGSAAFASFFDSFYSTWAPTGKPLIVGETGAPAADQIAYLGGLASQLPTNYPRIKGLVYWDARGQTNWVLQSSGLTAFAALGANPYFNP